MTNAFQSAGERYWWEIKLDLYFLDQNKHYRLRYAGLFSTGPSPDLRVLPKEALAVPLGKRGRTTRRVLLLWEGSILKK